MQQPMTSIDQTVPTAAFQSLVGLPVHCITG